MSEELTSYRARKLINRVTRLRRCLCQDAKVSLVETFVYKSLLKRALILTMQPDITFKCDVSLLEEELAKRSYKKDMQNADDRIKNWITFLENEAERKEGSPFKKYLGFFKGATLEERRFMLSILKKDLKIGLTYKQCTRLFGDNYLDLPPDFMRAGVFSHKMKLTYPLIAEPCFDGEKLKVIANRNRVNIYDPSFAKRNDLFYKHPLLEVVSSLSSKFEDTVELDLIIQAKGKDWSYTVSRLMRTDLSPADRLEDMSVYVADVIVGNKLKVPYSKRREKALKVAAKLKKAGVSNVAVIPSVEVTSNDDVYKVLTSVTAKGLNPKGLMLKDPDSPYVRRRDSFWLKVRPSSLKLISATIQELVLASLSNPYSLCGLSLKDENGKLVLITRFPSESQRLILAEMGQSLIGKKVEYFIDETNGDSLFHRIRCHKDIHG